MGILKTLILLISGIGFYLHIKRKTQIKDEFIPIVIISSIGVIEFIAGILNIMELITITISIVGLILFIKEIFIMKKTSIKLQFSINAIIFSIIILISIYLLRGTILTSYDNFSHWGMIVREMLLNNRLPNFQDILIMFTSYPPGTACFIYYICKFIGTSESCMLFAQSLLIISSIYTIFAFCNKDKKINYFICIATLIFLLIGNIFIDTLLVDTVLSVMGIAALAIIFFYKDNSKKALLTALPVLSLLAIVKNSAIFFIIIDILIWFWYFIKNNNIKAIFKTKYLALILLPIALLVIWKGHTSLVFEDANASKHAMTISNYDSNMKEKDISIIKGIFSKMLYKMISFKVKENIIMLLLVLVLISLIIITRKNKKLQFGIIKSLLLIIVTYILYQISLFGMYIFSMPVRRSPKFSCLRKIL